MTIERKVILVKEINREAQTLDGKAIPVSELKDRIYDLRVDNIDRGKPMLYDGLTLNELRKILNSQKTKGAFVYVAIHN